MQINNISTIITSLRQSSPKFNKHVKEYNVYFGTPRNALLPIYYNNPSSLKLCFPDVFYSENDVIQALENIKKTIKANKFNLNATMEEHNIGGHNSYGWCIRIKKIK